MNKLFLGSTLLLALSLCACGSSDDQSPPPASSGGGSGGEASGGSGGTNAAGQGGGDTGGTGAASSGGSDQDGASGGTGPSAEAGTDADTSDEASGPNPEEGILKCGAAKNVICSLPDQICCQGLNGAECKPASAKCPTLTATVECDGPEDCESGASLCCAKISMIPPSASVTCLSACAGTMTEAIMCHKSSDCAAPQTCKSCQPPGGPAQMMCVTSDTCPSA
jgi:hypothetical protein